MLLLHHGRNALRVGDSQSLAERVTYFQSVEAVGVEPTSSRLRGGCLADVGHTSVQRPRWDLNPRPFP